jgi:hypothetical protein
MSWSQSFPSTFSPQQPTSEVLQNLDNEDKAEYNLFNQLFAADGHAHTGNGSDGAKINASAVAFTQSGTGAVARTIGSKLQETISAKDFGAVGDGVTNDTVAIQAAIDYANSIGGGRILLPGAYVFTHLVLKQGALLEGVTPFAGNDMTGHASKLLHLPTGAGTDGIVNEFSTGTYTDNFGIRNIAIIADPSGKSRYGISFENYIGCVMENLTFIGCFSGAAFAEKGALNCRHRNWNIINTTNMLMPAGILLRSWDGDLWSTTSPFENVYIHGHLNNDGYGIQNPVVIKAMAAVNNVFFYDCVFESCIGSAIKQEKGNKVVCVNQYVENIPNADVNIPIFEVGVVGGSAPNNTNDTNTTFALKGESEITGRTGGDPVPSNIVAIKSDVALYIDIQSANFNRVNTLIEGTNDIQYTTLKNINGYPLTTIYTGLTPQKVHIDNTNNFGTAASGFANFNGATLSNRNITPAGRLIHGMVHYASDLGAEGAIEVYNKLTDKWSQPMPKYGAAPTTGTWRRGDIVFHTNASQGRPSGWVCITAGTPGVWEPFGQTGYYPLAASPVGVYAPNFIGEECFDYTNKRWYKSTGLTNADWKPITS